MLNQDRPETQIDRRPVAEEAALAARPDRRPMLATLMVASAVSPLAINIFIPSMVSISQDLDVGTGAVGLGLSFYLAATAIIQLLAGPLSDRYGRRPVILGGIALFLVGTLVCLFARSIEFFLLGRVIQASSATGLALSRAVVRDLYAREKAASMIGYLTMGFALAPMFGPAIGGTIDLWLGWRAVFWLLGGVGAVALVLLYVDLSETNVSRGTPMRRQWPGYLLLFQTRSFWGYTAVGALVASVFFAFLGAGPFIAVDGLGMSPAGYGIGFMFCSAGYIGGNFLVGRLSQRIGLRTLMTAGTATTLAGGLLALVTFSLDLLSPLTLFAPMLVVGFGNGLAIPTSTAGALSVRPDAAGAASGLSGALTIALGALVSAIAASLSAMPVLVAGVMTALAAASLFCVSLVGAKRMTS